MPTSLETLMPDRSDLAGTTIASRYRLGDERSGGSGSSRVFDATDVRRNVRVVLRLTPVKDLVDLEAGLAVASDALEAAKEQAAATARITHPVLSGPAIDRISNSPLDELVVTDTIPLNDEAKRCKEIRQLSCAALLAETIRRISKGDSVMSLFAEDEAGG